MSTPVRRADLVAGGVAAGFGAGLFLGLAPAASLAGRWLLVALVLASAAGGLAVLFTLERPLSTLPVRLRRFGFAVGTLGRLAAAVAIAGTVAVYLTPFAAVVLVVVVTVAAVAGVPPVVHRIAAVAVLAVLAAVVAACFAITPVAPAVTAPEGGSVLGVLAAAGLLAVCFFGTDAATRRDGAGWGVGDGRGHPEAGNRADSGAHGAGSAAGDGEAGSAAPGDRGGGRARRARRGVVVALVVVAIACLAVTGAVLRQLGAPRLAASPAPLRAALAAADASAIERLLIVGVVVGCGFALLGVFQGLRSAGIPRLRLVVAAGLVTVLGILLVPPTAALATAAVLLLGDATFRVVAGRRRDPDR